MIKKIVWQWEYLDEGTRRAKVLGGWILNTHRRFDNGKLSNFDQSSIFIPDRDHEWQIIPPVIEKVEKKKTLDPKNFESK